MDCKSVYVHFPFCETRCHYCDFYSLAQGSARPDDPDQFEKSLFRELTLRAGDLAPRLDTLYFGGGTPSLTKPSALLRAIEPLLSSTTIDSATEWTMEANPSSITRENLSLLRRAGVNRLSMGIQALQPALLRWLGRAHDRARALAAIGEAFEAGFENISVDVLCGVPGLSLRDLEETCTTLLNFPVTHVSCYLLTLPPHHKLYKELPSEEIQLQHLLWVHEFLESHGFEHYEVSNYARPGLRSRHNMAYWTGQSYLGVGPSAHSFDARNKERWKNVSSLHRYIAVLAEDALPVEGREKLSPAQLQLERWMLALRLSDGFPIDWLDTPARRAKALELEKAGLLETHPANPAHKRLTPRGFTVSDQVITTLS